MTARNPEHTFTEPGTFTVTLSVFNVLGQLVDSFSMDYVVKPSISDQGIAVEKETGIEYFNSLLTAYIYADGGLLKIKANEVVTDMLEFNGSVSVTIQGGYDDLFDKVISASRVKGPVIISDGTVKISNIIIGLVN